MALVTAPGTSAEATALREDVGSKIGPYRLVRLIGRGGMGVVFEGQHERIGQRAAIKLLAPSLGGELSASAVRRFLTEARALCRVAHPGLVQVFDCGETASGAPWISMEYVDGEVLRARIARRSQEGAGVPSAEAIRAVRQLASAVAALHRAGVIHRDLKPENVMVVADEEAPGGERVKLLDFGIAKLEGEGTATTEGMVLGTAGYMAPEQCAGGGEVDGAADVYALGVMLFELLAGRRPFLGDAVSVMKQHLFVEPPPIEELVVSLPEEVTALVHAMLAKEPSLRPAVEVVAERLRAFESGDGAVPRPSAGTMEPTGVGLAGERTEPAAEVGRGVRTGPSTSVVAGAPEDTDAGEAFSGKAPSRPAPREQAPTGQAPTGQAPTGQAPSAGTFRPPT